MEGHILHQYCLSDPPIALQYEIIRKPNSCGSQQSRLITTALYQTTRSMSVLENLQLWCCADNFSMEQHVPIPHVFVIIFNGVHCLKAALKLH